MPEVCWHHAYETNRIVYTENAGDVQEPHPMTHARHFFLFQCLVFSSCLLLLITTNRLYLWPAAATYIRMLSRFFCQVWRGELEKHYRCRRQHDRSRVTLIVQCGCGLVHRCKNAEIKIFTKHKSNCLKRLQNAITIQNVNCVMFNSYAKFLACPSTRKLKLWKIILQ